MFPCFHYTSSLAPSLNSVNVLNLSFDTKDNVIPIPLMVMVNISFVKVLLFYNLCEHFVICSKTFNSYVILLYKLTFRNKISPNPNRKCYAQRICALHCSCIAL